MHNPKFIDKGNGFYDIEDSLVAYSGSGQFLPGWPLPTAPVPFTSLAFDYLVPVDLDMDGIDELLDWSLGGFDASGSHLPQWLAKAITAVADLDNDGRPELFGQWPRVYQVDGSHTETFAATDQPNLIESHASPVIGDVNGDGRAEVIIIQLDGNIQPSPDTTYIPTYFLRVLSADGTQRHSFQVAGPLFEQQPIVLADMDCDGVAEIVIQTLEELYVMKANGAILPGWPQTTIIATSFVPVVGDVDGDGRPDIVTIARQSREQADITELRAYNHQGQLLQGFPKQLDLGLGAEIAIADIDLDGRNEIVAISIHDSQLQGKWEELWVFDMHGKGPYGTVQWGHFGRGPERHHYLPPGTSCSK